MSSAVKSIIFYQIVLLSSLRSIGCQKSVTFCEALKDNDWTISYTISVPNGTFHHKFVVIKDRFWRLVFTQGAGGQEVEESSNQLGIKGIVTLEDQLGTYSNFLSGDYRLGFGVRYGQKEETEEEEWTQTAIILANLKNNTLDGGFIDRKSSDLPKDGSKRYTIDPIESLLTDPGLAFVSFSNQSDKKVTLIEQRLSGKNRPKYRVNLWRMYVFSANLRTVTNDTFVPIAVEKALDFYKIKGIFGVSLFNAEEDNINGVIFLIEWCDLSDQKNLLDITSEQKKECQGKIVYLYCVTNESDPDPMKQNCAPALVTTQKLVDCSEASVSTETDSYGEVVSIPASDSDPASEQSGAPEGIDTPKPNESLEGHEDNKKNNSMWIWIVIAVIGLIVILTIIVLILMLGCRRKKTEESGGKYKIVKEPIHSELSSSSVISENYGTSVVQSKISSHKTDSDSIKSGKSKTGVSKKSSNENKSLAMPSVRSKIN